MGTRIQDPEIKISMEEMKETLLTRIFLSILAIGLIFIVVNFINELTIGSIQMTYPVVILYIILLSIYIIRERIPFALRAYTVMSILFVTGIVSGLTYGMIGLSMLFYIGASYTAMLLLSKKETILWMVFSLMIYVGIYALWVAGIVVYDFSVEEYALSFSTMISRIVAFIFFVGLMIFSQWMVNQFLVDQMNELKRTHDNLKESDNQLQLQYEEILENREQIKLKEEQYRSIIENTFDLIYAVSPDGKVITANSAMIHFLRETEENVIDQPMSMLAERFPLLNEMYRHVSRLMNSTTSVQFVTRIADGDSAELRTYHTVITPVMKETAELNLLLFKHHDVTELLLKDEKIEHLAYYDQLTGLSNRTSFEQITTEKINGKNQAFAIIYFDLDHFKKINDSIGHHAGDNLLVDISTRLMDLTPEGATLARLGGDEFALLLDENNAIKTLSVEVGEMADCVVNAVQNPVVLSGVSYYISASAGIVFYPDHGLTYEELMKNVDTAMYRAKNDGKNKWLMFNDRIKEQMNHSIILESHLRHAFEYQEMHINYQPLIHAQTESIRGFEALMRWQSSAFGAVPPDVFIPILEQTGLIVEYGEWILREAVLKVKEWEQISNEALIMSVNISLVQLKQETFPERIVSIIQEADLAPGKLELEITESFLADDVKQITSVLSSLRSSGIRIALDDFGTGFSSLSYLHRFPLDTLKIDKAFSEGVGGKTESNELIGSIIEMAHNIGLEVVAEGIENAGQVDYLKALKCDIFQGFYFQKPLAVEEADALIQRK